MRKDGSRFWANVILTAMYDENRILRGFAKVTRDFTERQRIDKALAQSEERFRMLVHVVRDYAIFMADPGGRVMTWNEGAERAYGYTAAEAIGLHVSRFHGLDDHSGSPGDSLERAARAGTHQSEGWRVRKDGTRFWAEVTTTTRS